MAKVASKRRVSIFSDIVDWSAELPIWQRDALRRIVETGRIELKDVDELTTICRHANGLSEDRVPRSQALTHDHVAIGCVNGKAVSICSISNPENVNILDPVETLSFAPSGLTVVFGYNGSGKSGYGRILRRACRSRNRGPVILPNILKPKPKSPASAEVVYALDGIEQLPEQWIDGQRPVDFLGAVSFFDSDCASTHVRERNDIAFTPFGLDVLPALGTACKEVQKKLDSEKRRLEAIQPLFLRGPHATGTTCVGVLLRQLSHRTTPEALDTLASLTPDELVRLKELPGLLATDPARITKELRTKINRIVALNQRLADASERLNPEAIKVIQLLADDSDRKWKAAEAAAGLSFSREPLRRVGEDVWRELWEAARRYSTVAYHHDDFPVIDSAVCVLCQQPLDLTAQDRLKRFEAFVSDDTATQAKAARSRIALAIDSIKSLGLRDDLIREQLKDIESSNAIICKSVRRAVAILLLRLRTILKAHKANAWCFTLPFEIVDVRIELNELATTLKEKADDVERSADPVGMAKVKAELAELQSREWLATVVGDVKEHVDRLIEIALLKDCMTETKTNRITAKSKSLAKEHVTDQLRNTFADEIKKMDQGVRRLNVELVATAGEFGASYYRVQLVGATDADVGTVVSEGEHRCIALAGFLSELATEQSCSAIVFDDPVTSLDHHWRECFAGRLVDESMRRQVIVFTHDIVFLHDLISGAKAKDLSATLRRVKTNRDHCGVVDNELPWIAQKSLSRIDDLEKRTRATRAAYDAHDDDNYERDICSVYGDIRATVERTVEEYFFKEVVVRHRDYISLDKLKLVTAINADHCDRLKLLFKRCCEITKAHDRASLRSFGIPSPQDALDDLAELRAIIDDVKDKQKSVQ